MSMPAAAATAAKAARKYGPGSRGANAGKPKAADELARRQAANAAPPKAASYDPSKVPLPKPLPAKAPAASSGGKPAGGFLDGVRDGAAEGRTLPARGGSTVQDGAGVVLGFLVWVWVVLPYLNGGASNVGAVLKAKFTNKGPDGSDLP